MFLGGFESGIVQRVTFVALTAGIVDSRMVMASPGLFMSAKNGCSGGACWASKAGMG